jgi:alkyl hydroperoxide reductase subunit F
MIITSFMGNDKLTGIALQPADGGAGVEIAVEGVFLEIGLIPNSEPLRGLVRLNESAEVMVNKDQSTDVPGLFAAGDVTDIEEKQISVAVGQGARAGIASHDYLMKRGMTKSTVALKEEWQ